MNIEESFSTLMNTILVLYKNILLRKFFFNFLNIHYETTIFKAQPTHGKQKVQEKPKEEIKIDSRVEEALETAKKVSIGLKPTEPKKPELKKPTSLKKSVERKQPEAKKPELKTGALKKAPQQPELATSINPIETYNVTFLSINPDLMTQYQELKSRYTSSLYSNLGGQSQGKKAELTAKKSFLTKLNKKFTSKNIRTRVDDVATKTYAAYKVLSEIQLVLSDEDILRSFFELGSQSLQSYSQKSERIKLFKANYMLNWIQKCLDDIESTDFNEPISLANEFKLLILESTKNAESINKTDGFSTEKTIINELLKCCTPEEIKETTQKYLELDKWKLNSEVNKFIISKLQSTKSLPGLRVLHSLGCKQGKSFCTFTKK
jgi:hypothetical protein